MTNHENFVWLLLPAIGICVFVKMYSCACLCSRNKPSNPWVHQPLVSQDEEAQVAEYKKIEWIDDTPSEIKEAMLDREWIRSISATAVIPPIRLSR
jgi:hypothetical protein